MSHATVEDYAWQHGWEEIYTVTFVRGLDERETLRRFGVADQDMRSYAWEELWERVEETDGCCDVVVAARAGGWTVAFELNGWQGIRWETLRELSRGGEAVTVMRHDYAASHRFMHAVDGVERTGFRPEWPQQRWGALPDALNGHLRELGLPTEPDDELDDWNVAVPASLALASRISGVLFDDGMLGEPLFGGVITVPVPDDPPPAADPLAGHALTGRGPGAGAAGGGRRRPGSGQARTRLGGRGHGPADRSGDRRADRRSVRGVHRSPGGRYTVTFVDSRTGERTCPTCAPWRRPSGEERDRARARWQAATAVRSAFATDEREAAYDVHLTVAATDPEHAAAIVRVLRGEGH